MIKIVFNLIAFFIFSGILFAEVYIPNYLWNLGFAIAADQTPFSGGLPKNYGSISHEGFLHPKSYIYQVKNRDIIWVQRSQLNNFFHFVLPTIKSHFVLVISDGDLSFPSFYNSFDIKRLLNNRFLIAVFAQNVDNTFAHRKIHPLPIGLDFHSVSRNEGYFGEKMQSIQEQEAVLNQILISLSPTHERKKRVLLDFVENDFHGYGESRTNILSILSPCSFVDCLKPISRHAFWKVKGEYAFAVSPHGYGLDCHRTWEGLVLGNIVIVKTSSLDSLYEGLPVVIVQDWSEINESNLDLWLEKYKDAFTNPEYRKKLTHEYWMNKIRKTAYEN